MTKWVAAAAALLLAVGGSVYFFSDGRTENGAWPDPNDPELVARGEPLYAQYCASCHGANLEGEANWRERRPDGSLPAPPHDETGHTWHHPDSLLIDYTLRGGAAFAQGRFESRMPGFEDQLSREQVIAIIAFIKSTWPEEIQARHRMMSQRQ